ncbi:hypothetical protein HPB50_003795 [Hyalomma asiaticum]|uniref:Uncharacterized protein n=1 Tax=Hyalomma asiaticum TaxID=266040 RepID=A0ACB7S6X6_HYAAI|nr:hypothetical protein HPB50_003795 [Hyalomma asiaticum]
MIQAPVRAGRPRRDLARLSAQSNDGLVSTLRARTPSVTTAVSTAVSAGFGARYGGGRHGKKRRWIGGDCARPLRNTLLLLLLWPGTPTPFLLLQAHLLSTYLDARTLVHLRPGPTVWPPAFRKGSGSGSHEVYEVSTPQCGYFHLVVVAVLIYLSLE